MRLRVKKILSGFAYHFDRNIGWQDRAIRTIIGIVAAAGACVFWKTDATLCAILGVLAIAQFWTAFSAKCIICFFIGKCTIGAREKKYWADKGVPS